MALIQKDRVKQQTTTTGTGTYTLSGSFDSFQTFAEIGDGNTTYYCCTDGTDFEIGIGTYTASGTTLARTTILQSSNSDAAVNWTSGTRTIFCTQPADKAVFFDADGAISIPDGSSTSNYLGIGNSDEFKIYHDGNQTVISNVNGSGPIKLQGKFGEQSIIANQDGAVELYHNNNLRLTTTTDGVRVTGGPGDANLVIEADTDNVNENDNATLTLKQDGGNITGVFGLAGDNTTYIQVHQLYDFQVKNSAGEVYLEAEDSGPVNLYYDNTKRFETSSVGSTVTGTLTLNSSNYARIEHARDGTDIWSTGLRTDDDYHIYRESGAGNVVLSAGNLELGDGQEIRLGDSDDLKIYHDGSNSYIQDSGTGGLVLMTTGPTIGLAKSYESAESGFEWMVEAIPNGSVKLRYDSVQKFSTTSSGIDVIGTVTDDGATHDGDVTFTGASYNVVWDKSDNALEFGDNAELRIGDGTDLKIWHQSSTGHTFIQEQNSSGSLKITANETQFLNALNSEYKAKFKDDGAVELYYNGAKKVETTSGGIEVDADGSGTVGVKVNKDDNTGYFFSAQYDGTVNSGRLYSLKPPTTDSGSEPFIWETGNAHAFNTDGTERLRINSSGDVEIKTGHLELGDSQEIRLGDSQDMKITHTGTDSVIVEEGTGNLLLGSNSNIYLYKPSTFETMLHANANGAVSLYYDNVKKFETTSDGISVLSTENHGPVINLISDDPADAADFTTEAQIKFFAENDASEQTQYATIFLSTGDVTDGTEDGWIYFQTMHNGSLNNTAAVSPDSFYLLQPASTFYFNNVASSGYHTAIRPATPTASRTITLPDATGTVALENGNAVLLNTTTVSAGVSSVDFGSSLITDDFDNYLLVVEDLTVSAATDIRLRLGTANSADTSNLYTSNVQWRAKALTSTTNNTQNLSGTLTDGSNAIIMGGNGADVSTASTASADFTIRFNNLRSTTFHKTFSGVTGSCVMTDIDGANLNVDYVCSLRDMIGTYRTTSAVNFISIYETDVSSQISGGTFSLYGLKT